MNKSNQGKVGEFQTADLDFEWVQLLLTAKRAGIRAEEIRRFFLDKGPRLL